MSLSSKNPGPTDQTRPVDSVLKYKPIMAVQDLCTHCAGAYTYPLLWLNMLKEGPSSRLFESNKAVENQQTSHF